MILEKNVEIKMSGDFSPHYRELMLLKLKGLFHPACLARVISWFALVVTIFMDHENGDKQRLAKRQHVQGMLDERDPLKLSGLLDLKRHYRPASFAGVLQYQTVRK